MLSTSQTSHSEVNKQNRALTGSVTKLLDNFGFIDDSVFFQLSVVKGGDVRVGDKVYCECSYSEHLPFKWNATKVHLVQTNSRSSVQTSTGQSSQQQSNASQVATTYLQHRLQQQQQQQQTREEPNNALTPGIPVNVSHNYFSNQSNPSSYGNQSQFDFSKAQQAVAAVQQLSQYYGRNENQNSFSQLQYTSTPGSAFVSSALPFTQQIQANLLSSQSRNTPQNSYKTSGSRWEREERSNRSEDRFRNRDNERSRFGDNIRKERDFERDRNNIGREGRDEFGRDLRRDREREREKERERERLEKEKRIKRSESPNSISSQNVSRIPRRRYEPVNIPKLSILKNPLNVYDIKQRYSANLHVPSDLKEVIINSQFSLNISDIPKPITFRVIDLKDNESNGKKKDTPKKSDNTKDNEKNDGKDENNDKQEVVAMEVEDNNNESKEKTSTEQPICVKQIHKYGVKVLIISLPSMNDIYDRIFGSDFDAISTGSKSYFLHFNKLLAFLVSRNTNDGFSLIGGKFNPQLDGYLSGTEEPNLIATAIRVVGEQTGMNLTKCGKWKLIATFVYNRDNSVDPINPSLEFTRVYMPDIWSALESIYDDLKSNKTIINDIIENNNEIETIDNDINNDLIEKNSNEDIVVITNEDKNQLISGDINNVDDSSGIQTDPQNSLPEDSSTASPQQSSADVNSAMDLSHSNVSESQENTLQQKESVSILETTSPSSQAIDLTAESALDPSEPPIVDLSSLDNSSTSVPPLKENEDNQNSTSDAPQLDSEVDNKSVSAEDKPTDSSLPKSESVEKSVISGEALELQNLLSRINDMKVTELRAELEKRGARFKTNLKKADLITKLREIVNQLLEDEDVVSDEVKNDWWAQRILSKDNSVNDNSNNDNSNTDNESKVEQKDQQIEGISDEITNEEKLTEGVNETTDETTEGIIDKTNNDCVTIDDDSQMSVDRNEINNEIKKDDQCIEIVNQMESQQSQTQENISQKSSENGTTKRKSDNESPEKESKKPKNGKESQELIPKKVVDGCVFVKGGENLTVITLHEALNHQRYDQFEMSIVSELIRESLIHHFSHYMLSTLIHNHLNPIAKDEKIIHDSKTPLQVNYVHLSFAYFDSSHCGHILSEDLAKLLNNANFTLSRRAFNLLVSNEEKVFYRDLNQPKELLEIKKTNCKTINNSTDNTLDTNEIKIIEINGTVYDIKQLIEQSESDEKLKVRLNEELVQNKDKIEQFSEYINELENRQKKMTNATEKLNDEICCLKREREIIKNKYDSIRKVVEISNQSFNEVLKNQSE